MEFEWDEGKRRSTLADRGLDFRDTWQVFCGRPVFSYPSPREGEARTVTVGMIEGRMIAVVWTYREDVVRIISMRRARDAEEKRYRALFH